MTDTGALRLQVRRHDPDRYFCTLFAPAADREALFTLYAFNHELARACEVAREPGLALIRLQWWREIVQGGARRHEVATPLLQSLERGQIEAGDLMAMIEAREREAEAEFASVQAWRDWLMLGGGSLAVAAARALGAPASTFGRMRRLGAGFAAAGQLRSIAAFARGGRCLLPADLLARHGLSADAVVTTPDAPAMAQVRGDLADCGRALLGDEQPCDRGWLAAGLPAVLARRDLRQPQPAARPHGLGARLAVLRAAVSALC